MIINIFDLIKKSQDEILLSTEELEYLLNLDPDSLESYLVMAEARRISKKLSGGLAEVHAQFAINLSPCACNCLFCSFAKVNGIFTEETVLQPEDAVAYTKQFEESGWEVWHAASRFYRNI